MASKRQIVVGGVPIGGGAPVAVQTMTKTETANLAATMQQIRTVAEAGADLVRVAVPRDDDVDALRTIVRESPIPVIADIHFNYTLALKAVDAGAHCVRINPGNIGGPDKVAEGLGTRRADGVGDTVRISLSTFHAEEEVKVAWEIRKALKRRERGPVLIAWPTCGRLQFDRGSVVAEIEERLRAYEGPIEVAVLGCAVNGIGEASHADFGITGAKNEGLIFAQGKPLRKVPQERLVDELFVEIDKALQLGRTEFQREKAAEGAKWLERIEEENAGELTPERLAKLEAESARAENGAATELPQAQRRRLDEAVSPTEGRRFTRA